MNKQEKNFLSRTFDEKEAIHSFVESLQDVADSSMKYCGFPIVPIRASWDSDKKEIAYVTDKYCYLNLDSPLVKGLSFNARKKCIVGKMVHEIFGHWLHTDFSIFDNIQDVAYYEDIFSGAENFLAIKSIFSDSDKKKIFDTLFLNFHNIVEDPVIEYLAVKRYPGFKRYVDYLADRLRNNLQEQFNEEFSDETQLVMSLVLAKARNCFPEKYKSKYPEFEKIQYFEDLSKLPLPKDRINASVDIIDILWEYLAPLFEQSGSSNEEGDNEGQGQGQGQGQGTGQGQGQGQGQGTGQEQGQGEAQNQGQGSGKASKLSEEEKKAIAKALQEAIENDTSYGKRQEQPVVMEETDGGDGGNKNNDDLSSVYDKLEKEVAKNKEEIIIEKAASMGKEELAQQTSEFHVKEFANQGCWENSYNVKSSFGTTNYVASQKQKTIAKTLANNVAKVLRDRRKRRPLYNLEEGDFLDINAIACGSDKIFASIKRGDKRPVCAVSIMVDMSGSMSSSNRNEAAKDTAMVLNLFCKELKIPCCSYGHYYSSNTTISQVLDFYESPTPQKLSKLAHLAATAGCNHDGIGIRYGIAKLAQRPETQKILFVISDGAPNAGGYDTNTMISDMKEIKKLCKRHKVMLVPVAIGDDLPALTKIYGPKLVDGRNLENLPKNVSNILLQEIKKIIKN